jgi:L-ribulose-5-phosphate 4-epimerase
MVYDRLREEVCHINRQLVQAGLVVLTWGNASGADRAAGVMAIKPSGVAYDRLEPDDMIILELESGRQIEGHGRPSSETATHLHLYRHFTTAGGIVHTHSDFATSFAQAGRGIPCFGTTHADNFHGTIPCTREMTETEIAADYELNTGRVIVECFEKGGIDPAHVPGVLVRSHAPFTWGPTPAKALENAIVIEFAAKMCLQTLMLNPSAAPIPDALLNRHYFRKHGPGATYGQKS